jgi:hypothetical protein
MNMRKLSRPKLQICKQNKHLEISRQKLSWNIHKNCFINVHQFMADDTPTKSVPFLSPSSDVICIICYEDLQKKYGKRVFIIYTQGWYRRETNRKEKKTTTHPFDQPFFPLPNYCMTWNFILPNPISKLYKYFTYIYIYIYIYIYYYTSYRPL